MLNFNSIIGDTRNIFKTGLTLAYDEYDELVNTQNFANVGYVTTLKENGAQWKFDYTLHTLGKQRLPNTDVNPLEFRLGDFSEGYSLMNAQVTKVFSKKFEIYVGGENLTNFRQQNPVLGADNPFGANFDTSIMYAPIMGRMFYGGFRYKK